MTEYRFRLKRGEFELELAGDRDFVERQAERFLARLGEGKVEPMSASAPDLPTHLSEDALPRVSPSFRPKVNVELAEFVAMKEAREPQDVLVVAGYYMEKYLRRESYTRPDLAEQLEPVEAWACQDLDAVLERAVLSGFLDPLRDGRYTLTHKGQSYVRDGLQ